MSSAQNQSKVGAPCSHFATTRWSMIARVRDPESPEQGEKALAELCSGYWFPLYAYARRRGKEREDAEDLTQSFFAHLLGGGAFDDLSMSKGKFRSFLLTSFQRFMVDEWRKDQSAKRGSGEKLLSLDVDDFEERFAGGGSEQIDAERAFDRSWAVALIDRVYEKLGEDYRKAEKSDLFELLKVSLLGEGDRGYAEMAESAGMSEGGFTMAVHRLRRRFGEEIRSEVVQTVADPSEVEAEMRWLFSVLGGAGGR